MKKLLLMILLLLISFSLSACKEGEVPPTINDDCSLIEGTTTLECYKVWTSYLHTVVTLKLYIPEESTLVENIIVFNEVENIISFYNDISEIQRAQRKLSLQK